ncbi:MULTISPECIES: hypothetical protein [unclassified Acidovorax]|uniref:hypothetical protein n=1 Tax=unclassified Acidovorax TaxID=2684926 RepID=UPI0012E2404C|nr:MULTISPECIES: hypothetical protein [unclassified Acidovorax]
MNNILWVAGRSIKSDSRLWIASFSTETRCSVVRGEIFAILVSDESKTKPHDPLVSFASPPKRTASSIPPSEKEIPYPSYASSNLI